MSTIHLHQTTTATPEQFVAGLTDFGPGRSKLFPNSADDYLKVHSQGPDYADVTEGSGGVWERLHYDWSDPNHVVLTTTDSNVWGGHSGYTYTFAGQPMRAKPSRVGCLGSCSGSSASGSWERHWQPPSRPSKPGTTAREQRNRRRRPWTAINDGHRRPVEAPGREQRRKSLLANRGLGASTGVVPDNVSDMAHDVLRFVEALPLREI
jgi:hypothetical protein